MADMAFSFGLGVNTICTLSSALGGSLTFAVVESFDISAEGDKFELFGNNVGQTVVATRWSHVGDLIRVTGEGAAYKKPSLMRNTSGNVVSASFTMADDSASPAQISTGALTGTCIDFKITGNRAAWSYEATIRLTP
jgi:hypothetical protein